MCAASGRSRSSTRASPSRCARSGSPCAATCARCSRRSRWPTSPPARCPPRSAGSLPTRTPGSRTKGGFSARADVDDLPALELEQLGLLLRQLRAQVLAVLADELDPYLEAEVDDALDHRLGAAVALGLEQQLDVVRADERVTEPVDRADEAHHELVRGLLVELARRADLLNTPVVQDDDLAGDLHRLLLVVRDDDRRHVHLVVQAPQPGAQLLADAGVERAERLVEQQHARLDRERTGERHPLALATREL